MRSAPQVRRPVAAHRAPLRTVAAALAASGLLCLSPAGAQARALVAMIGDSTMWGGTASPDAVVVAQAPTDPAKSLAALLALLPPTSTWHDADVVNLAVPGTTTLDWVEKFNERLCTDQKRALSPRILDPACRAKLPLADAVRPALGADPQAILVLLGTNDVLLKLDPSVTVANLAKLRDHLPAVPIYLAPPLRPPAPPGSTFADEVRRIMLERGLLTGPNWPPLPTVDGLHLTEGGYAAAAGLWLDVLRKQAP